MKIKKLKINSLYHLKDLEFDFTYPKGHSKAGQPLDKICFIGQSATGKTRLLKFIRNYVDFFLELKIIGNSVNAEWIDASSLKGDITFDCKNHFFKIDEEKLEIFNYEDKLVNTYSLSSTKSGVISQIDIGNRLNILINFTSDLLSKYNLSLFENIPTQIEKSYERDIIDFQDEFDQNFIYSLLNLNIEHNKKYQNKVKDLFDSGAAHDMAFLIEEMEKWNMENKNPIDDLSNKLSSVFNKLFIEIDKKNVKNTIPFKDKRTGEKIPLQNLSTGTKSLLLYLIPLFLINPTESIILLDEPERSLFPDIQMNLIEYFKELTGNSQLIVATHSPFIAASFEPEERFLLYFDDDGNVIAERGVSPIGDDPNDILKNDFKVDYINRHGKEAFKEYVSLKKKIYFEKDESIKNEFSERLEELGEKYNF